MGMRLEVVQVPVADVGKSKSFYTEKLGFVLDHDVEHIPGMRVVQLTPPGSAVSIVIGTGMTSMAPGSLEGPQLVVLDLGVARTELLRRGAGISEIQDMGGVQFAFFGDPDGNRWVIQGAVGPGPALVTPAQRGAQQMSAAGPSRRKAWTRAARPRSASAFGAK
ncbi:VOC family protein [Arthrobacter sp. ISL-69]|nr:VOC family protein [Arthrobacter sp. ISL-69]